MKKSMILGLATALTLTTLYARADPPSWAGHGHNDDRGEQSRDHSRGDNQWQNENRRDDGHEQRMREHAPRISDTEREHFRHYVRNHPDDPALPPGLRGKERRGQLPPGWQQKVRVGHRLPDDLYYHGEPVPPRFYGDNRRPEGRYSDILLGDKVVRVLNATQTIIDVFGLNQ